MRRRSHITSSPLWTDFIRTQQWTILKLNFTFLLQLSNLTELLKSVCSLTLKTAKAELGQYNTQLRVRENFDVYNILNTNFYLI